MADDATFQVLLPAGRDPITGADDAALAGFYAAPDLPWLRANMVSTLDGAATGADARSGSINGPADHRVFEVLRAWADVVVVGAGTVRAERYRAPRTAAHLVEGRLAEGRAPHPALVIVTRTAHLPDAAIDDDPAPWVVTTSDAPGLAALRTRVAPDRLLVHEGAVNLPAAVAALVAAGARRILTEGGPTLLGHLLAARVVDELCLTWSPQLVGGPAPRPVDARDWLRPPARARLAGLLHHDGMLLGRWFLDRSTPH